MSKNILAIAAVSLVSLLSGVGLTLVFTMEALDMAIPAERSDQLSDVELQLRQTHARLGQIEKAITREIAATRREVRATSSARAAPAVRPDEPQASPEGTVTGSHVARDELDALPAANLPALRPLADWAEDQNLRGKWLFASESTSLDAFGAPDEVSVRGTSEWWTYWNVEGDHIASEYRVQFNNGRLVDASLVKWKKPRKRPTAQR